jgi:hypothetical protein
MTPLLFGRRFDVPPPTDSAKAPPQVLAKEWWGRRRLRYNVGLLLGGLLAFAAQAAVISWGIFKGAIPPRPDPDATFMVLLDGIAYLLMMGLANMFYFLGECSEGIIKPADYDRYRRITFSRLLKSGI